MHMSMRNSYFIGLLFFSVFSLALSGCGSVDAEDGKDAAGEARQELFAMDTYMTLSAYGEHAQEAVGQAVDEINRLDGLLSTGDSSSEVYRVNRDGGGYLSEDVAGLVERSLELYQDTDGAFDIAIYPVMEAWGFTDGDYKVPSRAALDRLLQLTDAGQIHFKRETSEISFGKEGMKIDLGGIAKGYTSNRVLDIFRENGVESGLVNLGGNVEALGAKTDGTPWRVAIQDPEDAEGTVGVISVEDCAVITSGGYERYFEKDGVTYHHIIDPGTGYPADSGLISVTVASADGTLADGLSTSLFIMGLDKASGYWKGHSGEFDMILMDDSRQLYVTEGIQDRFSSDSEVTVIQKQ